MYRGRIFAKKVREDGYVFDSEMEYKRYLYLKDLVVKGEINSLRIHPTYELQEEFTNHNGKKIKPLNYESDFEYYDKSNNKWVIEDVKGMETEEFRLHRKLFDYKYRDKLALVVLKYSKTTGFVPIEDYKQIMKTKRQQLVEEKNYYKNIVKKQEHEKELALRKQARELNRLNELVELQKTTKLTKAQEKRLNELKEKLLNLWQTKLWSLEFWKI